jgi:hypothetical protein
MLVVRTTEDLTDPVRQLVGSEQPLGLRDLACLEWIHLGSIAFSHGLLVGRKHATMHTPRSLSLTLRLWAPIQSRTSGLLCQLALSRIISRASLPLAWSLRQLHSRNRVLIALTGLPSTNLSQLCSSSSRYSPYQEKALGSGSSLLGSFSRRRTGSPASAHERRLGLSKRENRLSSSKPKTHSGWLWASRISRSRSPFFSRIRGRGSPSSVWLAASAPPAAKASPGWSRP